MDLRNMDAYVSVSEILPQGTEHEDPAASSATAKKEENQTFIVCWCRVTYDMLNVQSKWWN